MRKALFGGVQRQIVALRFCSKSNSAALVSPLYIVGKDSTIAPNVVIPDVEDLFEKFDRKRAEKNLELRQMSVPPAVANIEKAREYLRFIDGSIEDKKAEAEGIQKEFKRLKEANQGNVIDDEEMKERRERAKAIRKEIKSLVRDRWELEERAVVPLVSLPNSLKENCPIKENVVISVHGRKPEFPFVPKNHVDLAGGIELEMSDCSLTAFYLLGRLAKLEIDLGRRMQSHLLAKDYSMMSCPDFVKSVVVEGCGVDYRDPEAVLSLKPANEFRDRPSGVGMHLVGGSSLYAMVSFWAKNCVSNPMALPASYFSLGRRYRHVGVESERSLFHTRQSTSIEHFTACATRESAAKQFQATVDDLTSFYQLLGSHFRLSAAMAPRLTRAESYRMCLEMYSPGLDDFVEVANVSAFDEYISQRLMLKWEEKDRRESIRNLFVVGGCAMDVTKVIGILVECGQKEDGTYDVVKLG